MARNSILEFVIFDSESEHRSVYYLFIFWPKKSSRFLTGLFQLPIIIILKFEIRAKRTSNRILLYVPPNVVIAFFFGPDCSIYLGISHMNKYFSVLFMGFHLW